MDAASLMAEGRRFYVQDLPFAALDRFLILSGMPGVNLPSVWNMAGLSAMKLRNYAAAEQYLQFSLEQGRAEGKGSVVLRALINLMHLYLRANRATQALALAEEAETLAEVETEYQRTVLSVNAVAYCRNQAWDKALSRVRLLLQDEHHPDATVLRPVLLNNLGYYLNVTGETEEARTTLTEALRLALEAQNSEVVTHACSELARLYLRSNDWDSAVQYGQQAVEYLWNHMHDLSKGFVARLCELFGWLALSMEDRRRGRALVERASTYYAEAGWWLEWGRASSLLQSGKVDRPVQMGKLPEETVATLQYFSDLFSLLDTIEGADPTLSQRGQLVTHYALRLGAHMGLDALQIKIISHAGRLCDIGLTAFEPEAIAGEEGPRYRLHPELSAKWLSDFPLPPGTDRVVRTHHEHYDGTGFPDGLVGEEIPLCARILAVCETYVRDMQAGAHHTQAMENVVNKAGSVLDQVLVEHFVDLHRPLSEK